jgi:hypothetical protein
MALVIAGMAFLRANDRLSVLDAAASLEDATLLANDPERQRILSRAGDALSAAIANRPSDHAALAALARLRLLQAQQAGADRAVLLSEAEKRAAEAAAQGAPAAEAKTLQAEVEFARAGVNSEPAAIFIGESYAVRPLDARLAPIRARLGLALWGALNAETHERVKAEVCLALSRAPALDDAFKAAALAAHAPLLPSDYAAWAADAGCQAAP